jgi:hypothetical protein
MLSLSKRQLQRTADSAALAGAFAVAQSKTASTAANWDIGLNTDFTISSKVIENAPTSGSYAGDNKAVRVALTASRSTPFMSFFTGGQGTIYAEATAAVVVSGHFCMLSLEDTSATGITFNGNSTMNLGCGVATNAKGSTAITAGGSSSVIATPIVAVGAIPNSSNYVQPTTLLPYSQKQTDPFANLPVPSVPSGSCPALSVNPNATRSINPGCYKGMDIKGTLNLAPGTYYIDGSSLSFGSQAVVTGTEVTFILTSSTPSISTSFADLSMNGGATINLTSPTSGTYEGVLFYQDPRAPLGNGITINGNSSSSIEGSFYFPRAYLTYNGTSGMQTKCMQLVARRLSFSGNTNIQNVCPPGGGPKAFDGTKVRLVA